LGPFLERFVPLAGDPSSPSADAQAAGTAVATAQGSRPSGTAPKWRLLVKVVPLTLPFALAKLVVHSQGLEPWEFDSA